MRKRQRAVAATGGAAAVVIAAVVVAVAVPHGAREGAPAASPSRSADSAAPAAGNPAAGAGSASNCTDAPLKSQLGASLKGGASVIVATGRLTGQSATGNVANAGTLGFYAMTLQSVQTLRGPAVVPGSTAWISGPGPGITPNTVNSALLAPGGKLFAVVWPKSASRYPVGPTLQLAPIVGTDVVFTPYVCWNLNGLTPDQYQASTPLRAVPGGAALGGEHAPAESGVVTVPLATVEQVTASA
ncbi:MAG TPA: hypothetical protein VGM12_29190 [Trebonia sp.]